MKRILFLVFIACAVFCGSWVQARTQAEALAQQKQARAQKKLEREKKLEVLKELKEKGNQCGSANNAVGSEAYKACRACNNSVYPVKRRGSVEDIARARKLCDKALLLMNPETREDASGRRELEALQEKMENAYADIKYKDPNMSDDRINVICTEYEKHFAYTETLPWKQDYLTKKKNIDVNAMSTEQRKSLMRHKADLRDAVHSLLNSYKATTPVCRALENVPNYCSWRYELEKKKKEQNAE